MPAILEDFYEVKGQAFDRTDAVETSTPGMFEAGVDAGSVCLVGSGTYDVESGQYTVSGSGADTRCREGAFHYA